MKESWIIIEITLEKTVFTRHRYQISVAPPEKIMGFKWINEGLMGYEWDLMGFNWINEGLMGFEWDLMGFNGI